MQQHIDCSWNIPASKRPKPFIRAKRKNQTALLLLSGPKFALSYGSTFCVLFWNQGLTIWRKIFLIPELIKTQITFFYATNNKQ